MENEQENEGSSRGFAKIAKEDEEKMREIARKGGKAAHEKGTAHEFTSSEAQAAGRKGGKARQSQNVEEAPEEELE